MKRNVEKCKEKIQRI